MSDTEEPLSPNSQTILNKTYGATAHVAADSKNDINNHSSIHPPTAQTGDHEALPQRHEVAKLPQNYQSRTQRNVYFPYESMDDNTSQSQSSSSGTAIDKNQLSDEEPQIEGGNKTSICNCFNFFFRCCRSDETAERDELRVPIAAAND